MVRVAAAGPKARAHAGRERRVAGIGALCRERGWPALRLDGSTSIGKRQKLVTDFNDAGQDHFAFLLSSKAGGCGLNLVGGNRLILFDMSWNPAEDKQVGVCGFGVGVLCGVVRFLLRC